MKMILGVLILIIELSYGANLLKQFVCEDNIYMISKNKDGSALYSLKKDDFEKEAIFKFSHNIELKGLSYNILDGLLYAIVIDPKGIKRWHKYDFIKIGRYGRIMNLTTPVFESEKGEYESFKALNGTMDSSGNYYTINSFTSKDETDYQRAFIYTIQIGENPSFASLKFSKKELKMENIDRWKVPENIVFLNKFQKIFALSENQLYMIDPKKLVLKKIDLDFNSQNLKDLKILDSWAGEDYSFYFYAVNKDDSKKGSIFVVTVDKNLQNASIEHLEDKFLGESVDIAECIAPKLKESVSKVDVKVGDSYYYNFEISNPFPHPIKISFEDKLSQGLSFGEELDQSIVQNSTFISSSEIRIDDISIAEFDKLKFRLKVLVDSAMSSKIENRAYLYFRNFRFKALKNYRDISIKSSHIEAQERLISNADEDGSRSVTVGDTLTFEVEAYNVGRVPLKDVHIREFKISPDSKTCQKLEPGESCVLKGKYKVRAEDEKIGKIVSIANISTADGASDRTTLETKVVVSKVELSLRGRLSKSGLEVGDEVNLIINLENRGLVMATDINLDINLPNEISSDVTNIKIPYIDSLSSKEINVKLRLLKAGRFFIKLLATRNGKENFSTVRVVVDTPKIGSISKKILGIARKVSKYVDEDENKTSQGSTNFYRNASPIAKNDEITIPLNQNNTIDISKGFLINDTDLDGDPLEIIKFEIDTNGDGVDEEYKTGELVDIDEVGSLLINRDGSFNFNPIEDYKGYVPTITYTVSDGRGGLSTARANIIIGDELKRTSSPDSELKDEYLYQESYNTEDGYLSLLFFMIFNFLTIPFLRRNIENRQ